MPKLSPSPLMLQEARRDIAGHIVTVEGVIRHMEASNAGLSEIEVKRPVLYDEREGMFHKDMQQVQALNTTTAWRLQLTHLKLLARRLKEAEEECRSSSSSSPQPSQLGMQHTSMEDSQTE